MKPSPELTALAVVSLFTAILWVPIILNRLRELGTWTALKNAQPDVRPNSDWAYRLANAHRNAVENLVVFAPLVLIVSALDIGDGLTEAAGWMFVAARVAHALLYTLGVPLVRTIAFAAGFGCQVIFALRVLA